MTSPRRATRTTSLAARFVRGPHLSAPDDAEQRLADWLAELEPEQAAAIARSLDRFPHARTILLGDRRSLALSVRPDPRRCRRG